MHLIDTHCHLDFNAYDKDRDAIVERAHEHRVTRIINPGTDVQTSQVAIQMADRYPGVFAGIALHPNSTTGWSPEVESALEQMAAHEKVVAIGEIGLDYYWDKSPKSVQHAAFEAQLALASRLKLPVIIHNRDASDDVVAVLRNWEPPDELRDRPGVFHSFSAPSATADAALEMGFYLGFTGPVTFKKADDLRAIAAQVPIDRILIETDGPFLTPHPYRGKRNEPAYVRFIADRLAALHNMPLEAFAAQTTANAERLFQLGSL